jgi:hypothetical protein
MFYFDFYSIYARQPFRHALGKVHGTVLPSDAAKGDLEMLTAVACLRNAFNSSNDIRTFMSTSVIYAFDNECPSPKGLA